MYTLWHGDTLLGESSLEFSGRPAGSRLGVFHPTDSFAAIWPLMRRVQELEPVLMAQPRPEPGSLSPDEYRDFLRSDPANIELTGLWLQIAELHLEIRDETGQPMRDYLALVQRYDLDEPRPRYEEGSSYVLVATPRPPGFPE